LGFDLPPYYNYDEVSSDDIMNYEELGRGVVKRTEKRVLGLFIDGTGLDRATRRLNRGVTSGAVPIVARYYTLIPFEDDSRQRAFLDAVARAGLQVIVKRLPPKGITRQVSVDVEIAADILAFALGHTQFGALSEYTPDDRGGQRNSLHDFVRHQDGGKKDGHNSNEKGIKEAAEAGPEGSQQLSDKDSPGSNNIKSRRIITLVCPSRDLAYPISLAKELSADTITADFGEFAGGDVLKSASKWIDLSGSETIWRD
jgi:hypothetical protein